MPPDKSASVMGQSVSYGVTCYRVIFSDEAPFNWGAHDTLPCQVCQGIVPEMH